MRISEQTKKIQSFIKKNPNPGKISEKDMHIFYIQLIDCLIDHNHQYYIENAPILSDKEYDDLFDYLKKIEEYFPRIITSNSPTQWLVGQISEGFTKKEHIKPMLSLENTYNAQDLKDWNERIHKIVEKKAVEKNKAIEEINYTVEPKFDWLSVELEYNNGKLYSAITRGDGKVWEEILMNAKTIEGLSILKTNNINSLNVRGEIMMPKSVRKEINEERIEEGDIPFANTRNAAAGSIKLLDSKEVAKRKLICFVYDVLRYEERYEEGIIIETNDEISENFSSEKTYKILTEYKLPINEWRKSCKTIDEVINICNDPKTKKYFDSLDYDVDGLVIKVNSWNARYDIWSTDHHPRRAVAYKFPAQIAATQILSVVFQVGRTGIITPVANLEPVQLSGAKLQRVSLHNWDFIKDKDIHLHDRIWLQRSGEVIPYIVSVITDRRTGKETKINTPKICPSCQESVTNIDMHYYCTNTHCPEKMKQQIQHFVSKNCMDIQGIGERVVDILVDNKIVKTIADIYKLTDHTLQTQLHKFPGFGEKKVTEIAKGVEESKKKALRRLLNGLGIPHVGKKIAQDLCSRMKNGKSKIENDEDLKNVLTDISFVNSVYGIGEKTIENIRNFFEDKNNIAILKQLKKAGINMNPHKYTNHIEVDEAKGSFSITWSFGLSREKIAELFQEQGYIFHEQPLKTTDFMLIGDKAGSKKTKAQELWITIYEWREGIIKQFPFLKNSSKKSTQPKTQSLF